MFRGLSFEGLQTKGLPRHLHFSPNPLKGVGLMPLKQGAVAYKAAPTSQTVSPLESPRLHPAPRLPR